VLRKDPRRLATRYSRELAGASYSASSADSGSVGSGSSSDSYSYSSYSYSTGAPQLQSFNLDVQWFLSDQQDPQAHYTVAHSYKRIEELGLSLLEYFVFELEHQGFHIHALNWRGKMKLPAQDYSDLGYDPYVVPFLGPRKDDYFFFPHQNLEPTENYMRKSKYPFIQVALLPTLAFQKRMILKECKSKTFSELYNLQSNNEKLPIFGINAKQDTHPEDPNDGLLWCADRKGEAHMDFDEKIQTDKYEFLNEDVYAAFISVEMLPRYERSRWIDVLTKEAELATMVYTQGIEVFTLISIFFEQTEAGGIETRMELNSMADLKGMMGPLGIVWFWWVCYLAFGAMFFAGIGCVDNVLSLRKPHGRNFETFYSICLRFVIIGFMAWFVTSISAADTPSHEFELLLNSFLGVDSDHRRMGGGGAGGGSGGSASAEHETIVNFFYVFEKMKDIISLQVWVQRYGYVVILLLFFQGILYLNGHPRVAILTKTIVEGFDDIFHYFLLSSLMYGVIAFLGHWQLGPGVPGFETYNDTLIRQFEMVVGEFPWEAIQGIDLITSTLFMVYVLLYAFFIFFILLNFLLAIIVESYSRVKKQMDMNVVERNCVEDICCVVCESVIGIYCYLVPVMVRKHVPLWQKFIGFPSNDKVMRWIEDKEEEEAEIQAAWEKVRPMQQYRAPLLVEEFSAVFKVPKGVAVNYLSHHLAKAPDMGLNRVRIDNFEVHVAEVKSFMRKRELQLESLGLRAKTSTAPSPKKKSLAMLTDAPNNDSDEEGERPITATELHVLNLREIVSERQRFVQLLQRRVRERDGELHRAEEEAHNLAVEVQRVSGHHYSNALAHLS
jgi:hypothetical protein